MWCKYLMRYLIWSISWKLFPIFIKCYVKLDKLFLYNEIFALSFGLIMQIILRVNPFCVWRTYREVIACSVIVEALKVDSLQKLCSSLEPILRRVVCSWYLPILVDYLFISFHDIFNIIKKCLFVTLQF